jgi:phosphoribosylformylglycinamidine cyclo-ligase
VLPSGLGARFDSRAWTVPPIFQLVQRRGNVERDEMYRVFNMGIGMTIICSPESVGELTAALPEARVIGQVVKQEGKQRVVID